MLSPVRADSSIVEAPEITIPSTGTLAPGFKINSSPALISFAGISTSTPSLITVAISGIRFISPLIASVVFPFDIDSSNLPTVIRVTIMAADSKYRAYPLLEKSKILLQINETPDPIATKVSIFGARRKSPLIPFMKKSLLIIIITSDKTICTKPVPI